MKAAVTGELERSFWGWGYASKLPDNEARRALAKAAQGMLGGGDIELRPLPRIEDIVIPEPRVAPPPELAPFSSADRCDRALHTYGKAYRDIVRGFYGDFAAAPDFVAFPRTEDDVAAVLGF